MSKVPGYRREHTWLDNLSRATVGIISRLDQRLRENAISQDNDPSLDGERGSRNEIFIR
jgi:hypothetical protein